MKLRFSAFTLDLDLGELRGPDGLRHVEPEAFAVLRHLAENTDRVIGMSELIETVWGGLHVSDAAVATVIKLARKAVDDTGEAQTVIRTVRGQGFRMTAPVTILAAAQVAARAVEPAAVPGGEARGPPTIAVLPFRMPVEAGPAALLGDAVAAEVAAHLARLRWLRVIARESSFRFRAPPVDLAALHATLGADYVITGTLWREAGPRWSVQVDLSERSASRCSGPTASLPTWRKSPPFGRSSPRPFWRRWNCASRCTRRTGRSASLSRRWMPGKRSIWDCGTSIALRAKETPRLHGCSSGQRCSTPISPPLSRRGPSPAFRTW
ncbi:MAG: winged helix-turn-helix domain-containing protein [Pseudomonadota bacterium]